MKASGEFAIIEQYFKQQTTSEPDVILGIGDDCALVELNSVQAISVDTSIAGRHFPPDANAYDIAWRALHVALSDLAAMGATARFFTLALTLADAQPHWLAEFSKGLFAAAESANVCLIGGDTTKAIDNALSITVQVHGRITDKAWRRDGAKIGDYIYVTGSLGDAAAGLDVYQRNRQSLQPELLTAYLRPKAELDWVNVLQGKVNAAIDISDGFLADLQHVLTASAVGACIDIDALPLSQALTSYVDTEQAIQWALSGGDDYKLCITSSCEPAQMPEGLSCVGKITENLALELKNLPADTVLDKNGFNHFA